MSRHGSAPGFAPGDGGALRGAPFPTTRWSLLAAPAGDPEAARAALEALARRYWRPIAAWVRARWARSDEEALDATQDFFVWMLERDFRARADPARGSFRAFVKKSLENWLRDRERRGRAEKRGGAHAFAALDDVAGGALPDPAARTADELLDDLWRRALFEEATRALREELEAEGRGRTFAVFHAWTFGGEELDHAELARRHGLSKGDVSNHLRRAKERFRAHLRRLVLETVGHDDELRAELAWLVEERGP